ncbi:hypothetical protein PENANT_c116G11702 [Penicillium antarcticum]|uniref:HTH psq-type domain-containing protein n=1 Tax=Penicillium antarcticum TaxID=416450 RepID=A0A1V6PIS9_9EURO|nr:hypothetical protein PENANT_c116G11702 [Penicillium antarcticum]
MPPMRKQNRQKLAQQEGPLSLAIRAIEKGEIKSIREAARIFNVPRSRPRHEPRESTVNLTSNLDLRFEVLDPQTSPRFGPTPKARLNGRENRVELRVNSSKLTELEEVTLENWIISLDIRGAAPRPTTVRETANLLLAARG